MDWGWLVFLIVISVVSSLISKKQEKDTKKKQQNQRLDTEQSERGDAPVPGMRPVAEMPRPVPQAQRPVVEPAQPPHPPHPVPTPITVAHQEAQKGAAKTRVLLQTMREELKATEDTHTPVKAEPRLSLREEHQIAAVAKAEAKAEHALELERRREAVSSRMKAAKPVRPSKPVRKAAPKFGRSSLRRAVIMAEVLGRPVAERERFDQSGGPAR
jgi:type IV secretory pathway VirB10-like protein